MVETIQWTDAGVVMIDQRRLPREQVFVTCRTYLQVAEAIRNMTIRGAPAIGVAAAMGIALGVAEGADFAAHRGESFLGDRPDAAFP
jgi:methylthioribose-1-phosphate isomerase